MREIKKTYLAIIGLLILLSCTNTGSKILKSRIDKETHFHYFCKDANLKFSILYVNDTDYKNALIIGEQDTIFNILGTNGNNCGLLFCLLDNTDTICVMHNDPHAPLPKVVENKYHFKFFKIKYVPWVGYDYDSSVANSNYWLFSGLCDQGSYTFNYRKSHSDMRYPCLEPLEW